MARIKLRLAPFASLALASGLFCLEPSWVTRADAQGRRAYTRPSHERSAAEIEARESEITLTVAPIGEQLIQVWIRTAGALDAERKALTGCVSGDDAALVREGQRVRAFSPESKSSIYQARIRTVTMAADCTIVEAALSGPVYGDATHYVMEIIVDRGQRLAVANAAIIERDGRQVVYEQIHAGHYEPHEIRTGLKGEIYTEVLDGISAGMRVVTIGSFFIDAEYQLKSTPGGETGAHHNH